MNVFFLFLRHKINRGITLYSDALSCLTIKIRHFRQRIERLQNSKKALLILTDINLQCLEPWIITSNNLDWFLNSSSFTTLTIHLFTYTPVILFNCDRSWYSRGVIYVYLLLQFCCPCWLSVLNCDFFYFLS